MFEIGFSRGVVFNQVHGPEERRLQTDYPRGRPAIVRSVLPRQVLEIAFSLLCCPRRLLSGCPLTTLLAVTVTARSAVRNRRFIHSLVIPAILHGLSLDQNHARRARALITTRTKDFTPPDDVPPGVTIITLNRTIEIATLPDDQYKFVLGPFFVIIFLQCALLRLQFVD